MSEKQKYYITTAIAYTSGKPHIGNSYEIVLSDAIARFKRREGYDVFFQTGTDEHGQKIGLKAEAAGITPKEYVDKVAGEIKDLYKLLEIFIKGLIRAGTALRASRSGRSRNSWTENAPIAAEKLKWPKKRPISSE